MNLVRMLLAIAALSFVAAGRPGVLQDLPTVAAYEWTFFAPGDGAYLVGNMVVYKWMPTAGCFGDGTHCDATLQHFQAPGEARGRRIFSIGKEHYLAISIFGVDNPPNGVLYRANSLIYKWMPSASCFGNGSTCGAPLQEIATIGARDVEIIAIGGRFYLGVANYFDGTSYRQSLDVLEWLPESECFGASKACGERVQTIPTTGAFAIDSMRIGGETYLAGTMSFDGASWGQNSLIFKWMPDQSCFGDGSDCGAALQQLATLGAMEARHFTIDGSLYLAFADFYNGSSFTETPSFIYRWLDRQSCFGTKGSCGTPYQVLPSGNARGLEPLAIGTQHFLVSSNYYDGTSYNIDSKIYRWMRPAGCFGSGAACGVPFQRIPTSGAAGAKVFVIGDKTYLAIANYFDGTQYRLNSPLHVWMPGPGCFGDGVRCAGTVARPRSRKILH